MFSCCLSLTEAAFITTPYYKGYMMTSLTLMSYEEVVNIIKKKTHP